MGKFEESLKELEEVARRLENEDLDLEEAIELFRRGKELVEYCRAFLTEAETTIKTIETGDSQNEKL